MGQKSQGRDRGVQKSVLLLKWHIQMLNEKFSPGIPQNFAGGIWDKFLSFVNIIHDVGS